MESTLDKGQTRELVDGLFLQPSLNNYSSIVSLTSNELADILLRLSRYVQTEQSIDQVLEHVVKMLGEAGIAERVLFFQFHNGSTKTFLTNYWESPYVSKFSPVGFEMDISDISVLKFLDFQQHHSLQIEDISRFLNLPNYLLRNKMKAFFAKLKSKSLMFAMGGTKSAKIILNLQFCTRNVIWSNETEKLVQSIAYQLALAIQSASDKKKRESLQRNITEVQQTAIKEQEELLRKFASDIHDLPCSVIPNLKKAVKSEDFMECERLVDELHGNLRQLINEYVIPDITLLGFVNTIFQFINGFKKTFKGEVVAELPDEEINIAHDKALELFKVIREWFCNIEKHAEASTVDFTLKRLNKSYYLISISDNGKGFDPNDPKTLGYGISNIQKRLDDINAKFEIKSEKGSGSSLKIQLSVD